MKQTTNKDRSPWQFVPTQYFAEGLPYILVNNLSVVMFKAMHVANDLIGYTSFLYLPWAVKLFWAPFVDANGSKRGWVLSMQLALAVCFALVAVGVHLSSFFVITLLMFTVAAFLSATHDIATDGFYLHALDKKDQAFFTGIRATFYRLAVIFGSGILVIIAGGLNETSDGAIGWTAAFAIAAGLFALLYLYHRFMLPHPATDGPVQDASRIPFVIIFREYFTQRKIGVVLTYILLYRLGEGMLVKMAMPFLLDGEAAGGMGIGVSEVGFMYGTVGVGALVVGGILGGWMIKKYTLKKLIWPMAMAMNLPNLLYVYLAAVRPNTVWPLDLSAIGFSDAFIIYPILQACIIIEQFGYGLGFTAFMVYLLYISKGRYKTSQYAISTGIMAVGMMIPGFVSGWFQVHFGYLPLFAACAALTLPGMATIFFLPHYAEDAAPDEGKT